MLSESNDQNRSRAHLLVVINRIDSDYQNGINEIDCFCNKIASIQDSQVKIDLDNIKKGLSDFRALIDKCLIPQEQDKLLSVEPLREIRHDMRAAIGVIMGYSELVQDSLLDIKASEDIIQAAQYIHKIASKFLVAIDSFVLQQANNGSAKDENEEDLHQCTFLSGNVLIVDDSLQKAEVLSRKLQQAGHVVASVESGVEALECIKTFQPDIILLDLYMPGMNGDEVLQKLKADDLLKKIPVLMVSSSHDMDNIVKCIRLGADDYLQMPVNNTLLHARINASLTKKLASDREQQAFNELDESRLRLTTAIESIDDGFSIFDANDVLIIHNNHFSELYPGLKSLGGGKVTYEQLLRENIKLGVYMLERRVLENLKDEALEGCDFKDKKFIDKWVAHKLKHHRSYIDLLSSGVWIESIENHIPGGGVVTVHKDISKRKKKEEYLEYIAHHDALTGLANRKEFDLRLNSILEESEKEEGSSFAVAFFDLDGFKNVNDTLGHDFGDIVLKIVAQKLLENVRQSDIVARFGGDEFAAILYDIDSHEQIVQIAERCLEGVGTEVEKDGQKTKFGVSIGISIYPDNAKSAEELLKKADAAMYEVKKSGKGTYRIAS